MWVVLGVFYGLILWVAAMIYAIIVGGSLVATILICPIIVSSATIIICALGLVSEWFKGRAKAG